MNITLYNNKSPNNSIAKSLETIGTYTGSVIKETSDLYNITLVFNYIENMIDSNYVYIPDFGRYYYIDSFELGNQRITLNCHVDVLMTYRTEIEKCLIVVERNENESFSYLNDSKLPIECREQKRQFIFPNEPLTKNLEYIMICAGGVA